LCGACYEVCPVKINIPEVLVHLRNRIVEKQGTFASSESVAMKAMGFIFQNEKRFRAAQRLGRTAESALARKDGEGERWIDWLPGILGGWTQVRDLRAMPKQSFREWWEQRREDGGHNGD
jgi:L-lactate dehydrogenase complex protein LldF